MRGLLIAFFTLIVSVAEAGTVRIKDLVEFDGVRGNDLVGYGLVVGLNGTGDGIRNAPFTEEIMSNLLERLGVNVTGEQFRPKNVAAVLVTANLPPFSRTGSRIDVTVSAIGDAKSLLGGTLIMTPLTPPMATFMPSRKAPSSQAVPALPAKQAASQPVCPPLA